MRWMSFPLFEDHEAKHRRRLAGRLAMIAGRLESSAEMSGDEDAYLYDTDRLRREAKRSADEIMDVAEKIGETG